MVPISQSSLSGYESDRQTVARDLAEEVITRADDIEQRRQSP